MHDSQKTCQICGKKFHHTKVLAGATLRPSLLNLLLSEHPEFTGDASICHADLATYRGRYVQSLLEQKKGELSSLESEVIESIAQQDIVSQNVVGGFEEELTLGQKIADRMAAFGGSWPFLISFFCFLFIWITINVVNLGRPFDPFPFILLNLILSCLASIQAPVIMMSQNRQASKDRVRSDHEYQINLKAELEIRLLHEKLDNLLNQQWKRLVEIQQVQIEMLEEVTKRDS